MPVIFHIHPGGFLTGGSSWAGPEILLNEDVVLVTFQFRLGAYGFLSLGLPEYSGNMGLKDQALALQWVNDNIHNFGGNKSEITIYGHSAGAIAANLHLFSPQSKGLFRRAILSGGSAYNPQAFFTTAHDHTALIPETDPEALKKVDIRDFSTATFTEIFKSGEKQKSFNIIWAPVIESEFR